MEKKSLFFICVPLLMSWIEGHRYHLSKFHIYVLIYCIGILLSAWGWCHLHIWGYWYFSQQSWFQLVLHPAQCFSWCTLHRSPAQVGCMRQVLTAGALGRPRRIGWRGRWEWGSRWGIHVTPWLIHVEVWQNPLQYCKVISLQLIKKKSSTFKKLRSWHLVPSLHGK